MYGDPNPFAGYLTHLPLGQDLYQQHAETGKLAPPGEGFLIQKNNDYIIQKNFDRIIVKS